MIREGSSKSSFAVISEM